MPDFTSEDDLDTFEGWLKYQAVDAAKATPDELAMWRGLFDDVKQRSAATPKVGLMKLPLAVPGEHRYAVAVREGSDLLLTLWVRRSPKGDVYVLVPRGRGKWNPHASYHRDGTLHSKGYDMVMGMAKQRQPLTSDFRGAENIAQIAGHGPKSIGAICDPSAYSGVVEVPTGILGPRHGSILVDLVEPGCEPATVPLSKTVVIGKEFRDDSPWLVIRVTS